MHRIPSATIDLDSIDNLNLGTNGFVCFADRSFQIRNRVVWARAGRRLYPQISLFWVWECRKRGGWVFNSYTSSCKTVTKYVIIFNTCHSEISEYNSNSTRNFFFLFNLKKPAFPTTLNPVSNLVVDISGLYSKHTTVTSGNSSIETLAVAQSRATLTSLLSPEIYWADLTGWLVECWVRPS